jgi:hypothetical protein
VSGQQYTIESARTRHPESTYSPSRLAVFCAKSMWLKVFLCIYSVGLLAVAQGSASADGGTCPNALVRTGYSSSLPDCRGYELVSPPGVEPHFSYVGPGNRPEEDYPGKIDGTSRQVQASVNGNGLAFEAVQAPAGSETAGEDVVSTREDDGWLTRDIVPPQTPDHSILCLNAYAAAYSPDLSSWILADGVGQLGSLDRGGTLDCGHDSPLLSANEPAQAQNLFFTETVVGPYQLLDSPAAAPANVVPDDAWLQGSSESLNRVVFDEGAQLTPEAPIVPPPEVAVEPNERMLDLYETAGGVVHLITLLPDGEAALGALANGYEPEGINALSAAEFTHAVASDGSRVLFVSGGDLFDRLNAFVPQSPVAGGMCTVAEDGCTVEIDSKQAGATGASGGGKFSWASADGSRIFFIDCSRLTKEATAVSSEGCEDEEEYAPGRQRPVLTGNDLYEYDLDAPVGERLKDLSVDHRVGDVLGADVQGVSGVSDDGSVVYFVAEGVLSEAANSYGERAVSGVPNLYVTREGGAPMFIATLDEPADWQEPVHVARVTSSGEFMAFNSFEPPPGYDNTDLYTGAADSEIFRYDLATNSLDCVSCNPNGSQPTGFARLPIPVADNWNNGFPFAQPGRLQNDLSESGQVFFSTSNKLLPGAVNGLSNVYEWEDGKVYLISSGTGDGSSYFYEASPDGSNVFFITSQELPSGRPSPEFAVYDARVGGGFEPAGAVLACEENEVCRPAVSGPPLRPVPASKFGSGLGNVVVGGVGRVSVGLVSRRVGSRVVLVRVGVPAGGRLVLSGGSVVTARRSLGGAGSYTVRVDLTKKAWASLRRHHKLRFGLGARFVTSAGVEVSAMVSLVVK